MTVMRGGSYQSRGSVRTLGDPFHGCRATLRPHPTALHALYSRASIQREDELESSWRLIDIVDDLLHVSTRQGPRLERDLMRPLDALVAHVAQRRLDAA